MKARQDQLSFGIAYSFHLTTCRSLLLTLVYLVDERSEDVLVEVKLKVVDE